MSPLDDLIRQNPRVFKILGQSYKRCFRYLQVSCRNLQVLA